MNANEHNHVFLATDHDHSERKTWSVITLCVVMMSAEIVGGLMFGSIALVADGMHMSTHAGALLLAALAYRLARQHAENPRFSFGTGKFGDLAGFTSAIVLAMIALLIGYESIMRLLHPVSIHFGEAIPIACLGLCVNIVSAWLLSSSGHHHHGSHTSHEHDDRAEPHRVSVADSRLLLEICEDGGPPKFRLSAELASSPEARQTTVETLRENGVRQRFAMIDRGQCLESIDEIPEPHAFIAYIHTESASSEAIAFEEHEHGHADTHRDNNLRAAIVHVLADAAVSVLVIAGLLLAWAFGWLWVDPLAGIVGACVIASWSYGLVRDTGAILLDMIPDRRLAESLRRTIEGDGDCLADLHLWRVGPGHLAAIIAVSTTQQRDPDYYRRLLSRFKILSHVTVEVFTTKEDHHRINQTIASDND